MVKPAGTTTMTAAMGILSSGNVGIGTTAPAATLDIKGANTIDALRVRVTGSTPYLASFYNDGYNSATPVFNYFAFNSGDFRMGNPNALSVGLYAGSVSGYNSPSVIVKSNGDVGIGGSAGTGSNAFGTPTLVSLASGNVGIGTTSPNSTLHTNGSFATAYRAITALRTLDATDHTIEVTANTFNVTLPTAVGITGREYVITNSGTGVVTVGTATAQTFVNVVATPTTLTLAQFSTVTVQSNGANWLRITSL
jgi:hypothetical protein